jgi:putative membrane-bound dehydrogenase-like protein
MKDRILIFEDTNHDGIFDKRKVFWDKGSRIAGIEIGFGGVWVAAAPNILFIPDLNGDDLPDGEPDIILNGFESDRIRHNIVNGLRWGPDGWLYGRHGILATSNIGRPNTSKEERVKMNCGIFRYHPVKKTFEVVAEGTTNPWGHDWDEHGQLFFINTVIGHLWHVIPGARYKRMFGNHFDKHLYELIPQTADHYHWDVGNEQWSDLKEDGMTSATDAAGGGHAHSGMMIYTGNNWPKEYRGNVFTLNLHGRRINQDKLLRSNAGYVGKHSDDFMYTDDVWFRGIELSCGPDGGVYVLDWSDIGECHESDGVHRTSGRIFKISYGKTKRLLKPLNELSSLELVNMQSHPNEWQSRIARRLLQERAVKREDLSQVKKSLRLLYEKSESVQHRLRAMWALNSINGADQSWLLEQLYKKNEHIRVWAIKLLTDNGTVSDNVLEQFESLAETEPSGLVQLHLASVLRLLPFSKRWNLAGLLASKDTFANDTVLPLMIWYGISPAVGEDRSSAIRFISKCKIPKLRTFTARRLASSTRSNEEK